MADFIVAVTGGVASGKSAATRAFEGLGITVADADVAARAVVEPGEPALAEIAALFGPAFLYADGRLDRAAMRERVFADPTAKASLEGLLHPRIRAWLRAACDQARGPYVVAAIPLLVEGGARDTYPWLDRVLVVDVPVEVQVARLMQRDGSSPALARSMVAAQAGRGARLAAADDVIVNDGPLVQLERAVGQLHVRYLGMAADRA